MPPKPALTKAERLKKELQAQQARAEALKHLQTTGSGPSQSELARQQAERQKLKNVTSARVERFVTGGAAAAAAPTAAEKYDPRVRDNTLYAVALRRANEIHQTQRTTQQLSAYRTDSTASSSSSTDLPDGWTAVPDPASGDVYYWNEHTNETSWDRPNTNSRTKPSSASTAQVAPSASVETADNPEALPPGWEAVTDLASGDVYYWHRTTNETSWTRPAPATVSLRTSSTFVCRLSIALYHLSILTHDALLLRWCMPSDEAIAAKSRLDGILQRCGSSSVATTTGTKRSLSQTSVSAAQSEGSLSKRQREDVDPPKAT